jgi:hypothetical protein
VGASAAFAPTLIARSECADTGILGNTPLLEPKAEISTVGANGEDIPAKQPAIQV